MPRCDASECVLVFKDCDSVVEELGVSESMSSHEITAAIDLLLDRGLKFKILDASHPEAQNPSNGVVFRDSLANTGELADRIGVDPLDVVRCIDTGLLTGDRSPNGFYRMLVKDSMFHSITKEQLLSAKKRPAKKMRGKGLKDVVAGIISAGSVPSDDFGLEQIRRALAKIGWVEGRNYAQSSLPSAMKDLEYDGKVVLLVKSEGDTAKRRWGLSASRPQAAVPVGPVTAGDISKVLDRITDEIADRILEMAAAKATARISGV